MADHGSLWSKEGRAKRREYRDAMAAIRNEQVRRRQEAGQARGANPAIELELNKLAGKHKNEFLVGSAFMTSLPKVEDGLIAGHDIAECTVELWDANNRKAWTATRVVANAAGAWAVGGIGRKHKGSAAVNIMFADGHADSYPVKPEQMSTANRWCVKLDAYSRILKAKE